MNLGNKNENHRNLEKRKMKIIGILKTEKQKTYEFWKKKNKNHMNLEKTNVKNIESLMVQEDDKNQNLTDKHYVGLQNLTEKHYVFI